MKVLFVSSGVANNGVCPIVKGQGESLIAKGVSLDFFTINKGGLRGYLLASFQLRKYLKNKNYDIIHAHYGLSGITALIAKRKEKLVVSFMGDDIVGSNNNKGKITFKSKVIAKINILIAKWFFNYIIVKSPEMFSKAKSIKKMALIPNGVNLERFNVIDREKALAFTNLDSSKHHVLWISDPQRTEKNYRLAEDTFKLLEGQNIHLKVLKNIPNEQLPYYYNAADCLFLTSFHEGSPNVVKEAMACNCPIVSTAVGDVDLLFKNTSGNYLISYDKNVAVEQIKNAIKFRQINKYSNGREKLISLQYDTSSVANKIISIYYEINKIKK